MTKPSTHDMLMHALKGDAEAVAFVEQLCKVLHLWDDLEDRDKAVTRDDVDKAMYLALVVLPRNAFYRKYFNELSPVIANAIFSWHCANELEAGDTQRGKEIAYVMRSAYADVAMTAARIVGGYEWAREVAPTLRLHWHGEGFDGYVSNLELQRERAKEMENDNVLR